MRNLLKMERYQLLHNWIYWCGMIGVFLMGFVTAGTYIPEVMGPGGGAASSLTDILDGMVYDSTFLLIVISCVLALILGQEFSWRTVDHEICAGHSRGSIFASKIIVHLFAFNIMAMVYPIAGCIREFSRFGLTDSQLFLRHFTRAVLYSFVINSAILLIPILCCFCLKSMSKAIAASAMFTFLLSLYLGYGMMLGLPVRFLPTWQIRDIITHPAVLVPLEGIAVSFVWIVVILAAAWGVFYKCDLK